MTAAEALTLKKGDFVLFKGEIWRVDNVKTVRHKTEHVELKIHKKDEIMCGLPPQFVEALRKEG